jgi:subtilase family protein
MSGRVVAAVVRNQPLDTGALPEGANLIETLAPLPIDIVGGDSNVLAELRALPGVRSVTIPVDEEIAIVRGIAAVLSRIQTLSRTAPNGYAGRLPEDQRDATPAYPIMSPDPQYLVTTDDKIRRITRQCHPTALNLSLAPPAWLAGTLGDRDPLAVASHDAAETMVVVVAAGNNGGDHAGRSDTRSALAKLPWTVAVGATADQDGTKLDPDSSVGAAGGPGPFVCAFRESIHEHPRTGTSFAAPRVTHELAVLTGFLLTVAQAARADDRIGIPLCGVGIVDDKPAMPPTAGLPISAYPLDAGVEADRVAEAMRPLADVGLRLDVDVTVPMVLRALARSARPIPATQPWESGHGFVSEQTTNAYLRRFTGLEAAEVLGGLAASDLPSDRRLEIALADTDLERACDVWGRGALRLMWDYTSDSGHLD